MCVYIVYISSGYFTVSRWLHCDSEYKTNFANAFGVDSAYKADLKSELGCRGSIEISFVFDVRVFRSFSPLPTRIPDEMCISQSFAERGKFGEDDRRENTKLRDCERRYKPNYLARIVIVLIKDTFARLIDRAELANPFGYRYLNCVFAHDSDVEIGSAC